MKFDATDELKAMRGSYVRMKVFVEKNYFDGKKAKSFTFEGILGFSRKGVPQLNGDNVVYFNDVCLEWEAEVLFTPQKTAIKTLCKQCYNDHPLRLLVDEARYQFTNSWSKNVKCSLCGAVALWKVPPQFWQWTTEQPKEQIEKDLFDFIFNRKMKDAIEPILLTAVSRNRHRTPISYRCTFWSKSSCFRTEAAVPPPHDFWGRELELSDLKGYALEIYAGHKLIHSVMEVTK